MEIGKYSKENRVSLLNLDGIGCEPTSQVTGDRTGCRRVNSPPADRSRTGQFQIDRSNGQPVEEHSLTK